MEAIIARASTRNFEAAAAGWLRATERLGRATVRLVQYGLVNYSRAALLLRGGERPARRI
jgi:hypothetical protein